MGSGTGSTRSGSTSTGATTRAASLQRDDQAATASLLGSDQTTQSAESPNLIRRPFQNPIDNDRGPTGRDERGVDANVEMERTTTITRRDREKPDSGWLFPDSSNRNVYRQGGGKRYDKNLDYDNTNLYPWPTRPNGELMPTRLVAKYDSEYGGAANWRDWDYGPAYTTESTETIPPDPPRESRARGQGRGRSSPGQTDRTNALIAQANERERKKKGLAG